MNTGVFARVVLALCSVLAVALASPCAWSAPPTRANATKKAQAAPQPPREPQQEPPPEAPAADMAPPGRDPLQPTGAIHTPGGAVGIGTQARTNFYFDNDGNRIVTPLVAVDAEVKPWLAVSAHAVVDVMTCASVDVISAATPKGYFQETRTEAGGSATLSHDLLKLTLAGSGSQENDYSSTTASVAISDEVARRNATLSLAYSFTGSDVGRAHDPTFVRDLASHTLTAGWLQVVNRNWIAQMSLFVGVLDGFQSSVYRYVHFDNGSSGPEAVPSLRSREAAALELRGTLAPTWFLAGSYRYYTDSWGVMAHTGEIAISHTPMRRLTLRLRDRGYQQTGARFYQSSYVRPQQYMTIDRELGSMVGNLLGFKASLDLGSHTSTTGLELDVKVDGMWQHFPEFPWMTDRLIGIIEAGMNLTF